MEKGREILVVYKLVFEEKERRYIADGFCTCTCSSKSNLVLEGGRKGVNFM